MNKFQLLWPIIIYLFITILVAYYISRKENKNNFTESYFIGNRSMGAFVLAMTVVSTYIGASSFLGGPSIAYKLGLGWVLLACIQIPLIFFTLGVLGKKIAIISRKIKAVTLIDILRKRYNNEFLIVLLSVLMLIFLFASIIAQFIGGARLIESIIDIDYKIALTIFVFTVIFYTTIGGFKAVTITDAIQGLIMMISTFVLFVVIVNKVGSMSEITSTIKSIDPNLLTPDAGGAISRPYILSFWILVGIGILGLPATTVRSMGYKDSKALHNGMIIGTFVVGFLLIGMHLVGFMGRAIEPNIDVSDKLIPILALKNLHPIIAGIFIGGPLAAIMSTVDSLLILISSSIVKDLYINYVNKNTSDSKLKKVSLIITISIGLITYILSINPPSLIVWVNLFALAGQEVLFFVPVFMGLYWKRGNDKGAIASVIVGFVVFIMLEKFKYSIFGLMSIVPALVFALISYIIVSFMSKENDKESIDLFFE
ncbi:sodium/panthothenate symporter [Streptobacillus moniliformis]|uniref:Sodium/pantothenate symporter n=1 Tax=Streptobacillus moniliformis (strain ATCC 14647 / DSM 12112 / NCTC 10651 / 9901) TaxID=519441 RepID=D1AXK6_STRM9|nr:sodium/pantothenate symporter [Streptobacillus moniliformis]ACZ01032.1 sodium/pantothenate symporter [Streptobacillus moniliformis DSM 12112]AVL42598.1 sodium/panthothenate symporter [Streptobacillus moniliformis]SQA13829.1 Pantothenate permease [Streptobacillus moniliformis]